jgi:hypothetical protein
MIATTHALYVQATASLPRPSHAGDIRTIPWREFYAPADAARIWQDLQPDNPRFISDGTVWHSMEPIIIKGKITPTKP